MAFPLHAQLKHYDWGVPGALSHALGREPSGFPEAEIWWGNHLLAECEISTPTGFEDLPSWLEKTETKVTDHCHDQWRRKQNGRRLGEL